MEVGAEGYGRGDGSLGNISVWLISFLAFNLPFRGLQRVLRTL
jgi:hypothetical protein